MKLRALLLTLLLPSIVSAPLHAETFVIPLELASDNIEIYQEIGETQYLKSITARTIVTTTSSGDCVSLTSEDFDTASRTAYVYDRTTGGWIYLNVDYQAQPLDIDTLGGRGFNSTNLWSMVVPEARHGHVFAVEASGEFYIVDAGSIQGMNIQDENGNPTWESWGFFNVHAAGVQGWPTLIDVTAHESGTGSNLLVGTWATDNTAPIANVEIKFPDQVSTYTLHTSTGSLQSLTPWMAAGEDFYKANGAVAWGETFWVTRDVDDAQSSTFSSPADFIADARSMPAYGARNLVAHSFRIGEDRYWHDIKIVHGDGFETSLDSDYVLNAVGGNFYTYWDDNGVEQQYDYYYFLGDVDEYQNGAWTLHDNTTDEDLGANFDLIAGFNSTHLAAPSLVQLTLPISRVAHPLRLLQENGEEWNVSDPTSVNITDQYTNYWDYAFYGTPVESYYQTSLFKTTAPYNPNFSFQIEDTITGDLSTLQSSYTVDLSQWYLPGVPLQIRMNESRWFNDLVLVQPNFQEDITVKGNLAGSYSYTEISNQLSFISSGYYTLTPQHYHSEVPFAIWDATRLEYLVPDSGTTTDFTSAYDGTDSDGDGIPDWWELAQGLNPHSADSDGDGMSDADEIRLGRDPYHAVSDGAGVFTLNVYTPTLR